MRKQVIHILFSFILTLTVTDYLWVMLVQHHDDLVVELESKEANEEIQESEPSESRPDYFQIDFHLPTASFSPDLLLSSDLQIHYTCDVHLHQQKPRLYLYYQQLKIDYLV